MKEIIFKLLTEEKAQKALNQAPKFLMTNIISIDAVLKPCVLRQQILVSFVSCAVVALKMPSFFAVEC
jgi:hypothetical protein